MIVNSKDAGGIYSVVWYNQGSSIKLIDGWPLQYGLIPNENNFALFTFSSRGSVFCQLESLTKGFYPKVYSQFSKRPTNSDYNQVFKSNNYTSNHLLMEFEVPGETILYLQVNSHHSQDMLRGEFSIYCTNSFHPAIIQTGRLTMGNFHGTSKGLRYEVKMLEMNDLNIYVIPCVGEVKLEISTNWTIIKEETPDLVIFRMSDGMLFASIKNAIGNYYITVTEILDTKFALYQMLVDINGLEKLYSGNDGSIEWNRDAEDDLNFAWKSLEYFNETSYKGDVSYNLYFTEDPNIKMMSTCQIYYGITQGAITLIDNSAIESLTTYIQEQTGNVNIIATVKDKEGAVVLKEIAYEPTSIYPTLPSPPSGLSMALLLIIVSIIVLFIGCLGGCFYVRKRRLKQYYDNIEMASKSREPDKDLTVVDERSHVPTKSKKKFERLDT